MFGEALWLAPGKAQGWSYYLTTAEVLFEVAVRLVVAALFGMALGTLCALVIAPFLWFFKASRDFLVDSVTKVTVVLVVFLLSRYSLEVLIKWSYGISNHPALYDKLLLGAQFVVFAVALCVPRARRVVVTGLDGLLTPKMTRRTAVATMAGAAALVATEFALGKTIPVARAALSPNRPKSNFLLITFDALNAEDMSLYGRGLPTTPNIDAFARRATVFKNFYSACTFTTSSVATMMTGTYPSDTLVYQLQGRVRDRDAINSLPQLLRNGGYHTGAFLTNPFAYYLSTSLASGFDVMPEPVFQQGGLQHIWNATRPLHQQSGVGSRIDEYFDLAHVWNSLGRMPSNLCMRYRPDAAFQDAKRMLANLPDGFFAWVHVITPHQPYLPDSQDRGRFLPPDELRGLEDESELQWKPHYPPDQQSQVDRRRLLYDEFILAADRAFGAFISVLKSSDKLSNTTVVVSADHGEGFEGGVYQHSSPYLTRPVIHIPLIVRTPGQQDGRTVAFTADQTALAPTILELAGQPKPEWMRGASLVPWLNGKASGEGEGLAFAQYLEKNSVFKPLRHGTVGIIDGRTLHQYVIDSESQKGTLRPLSEAQYWNLDRSAQNPELAQQLRADHCISIPRSCPDHTVSRQYLNLTSGRLAPTSPQLAASSKSNAAMADHGAGFCIVS